MNRKILFLLSIATILVSLCACTSENTKEESSDLNVSYVLNSAVLTDNYDNKEKKYILNDNFFTDEYGRIVKIIDKKETMLFEYDVDGKLKSYTTYFTWFYGITFKRTNII